MSQKEYKRIMDLLREESGKFNLSFLTGPDLRKTFQEREVTRLHGGIIKKTDAFGSPEQTKHIASVFLRLDCYEFWVTEVQV